MRLKTVPSVRYKMSCGRIAGRSHATTETPCQDYVATQKTQSSACIALADGAGSRAHSGLGAEVAVKATLRVLSRQFDELYAAALSTPGTVNMLILDRCLAAMGKKAKAAACAVEELACTLLFVAHKDGRFLAGHLGDGIIAAETASGDIETLSHPDNGEFANTTVFVTDESAIARFRVYAGECATPAFAIMSDGTAESLYVRATGKPAVAALQKIFQWNRTLPKAKVDGILMANLEQVFSKKSADDCSIGLLTLTKTQL